MRRSFAGTSPENWGPAWSAQWEARIRSWDEARTLAQEGRENQAFLHSRAIAKQDHSYQNIARAMPTQQPVPRCQARTRSGCGEVRRSWLLPHDLACGAEQTNGIHHAMLNEMQWTMVYTSTSLALARAAPATLDAPRQECWTPGKTSRRSLP